VNEESTKQVGCCGSDKLFTQLLLVWLHNWNKFGQQFSDKSLLYQKMLIHGNQNCGRRFILKSSISKPDK